jgi:hypothetical protein
MMILVSGPGNSRWMSVQLLVGGEPYSIDGDVVKL